MAAAKHPGGNAGKGRPKGVPNKINADLRAMILGALQAKGGQSYLEKAADTNAAAFMTLLGKVLPTQLTGDGGGPVIVVTGVPRDGD